MSNITVIHGDCLDWLRAQSDKSVDAIIDDAPYGEGMCGLGEIPPQEVLTESLRVSRGAVITFGAEPIKYVEAYLKYTPQPMRRITWAPTFRLGKVSANEMMFRTQPVWCWNLPKKQYVPKSIVFDWVDDPCDGHNWWKHSGTKPLSLMKRLLSAFCPVGGTVVDRYAGSGTTLVAAVELGMDAIGIERELAHIDNIINKRVADARKQLALPTTEQITMFAEAK